MENGLKVGIWHESPFMLDFGQAEIYINLFITEGTCYLEYDSTG